MSSKRPSVGYSPARLSNEQVDSLLRGASEPFFENVYVDFLSNQPKTEQAREQFRHMLRSKFDAGLAAAVERFVELPPLLLQRPNDEYLSLLVEARDLFTAGYLYSCVAMCGIVGEKLIKDLFRASILVSTGAETERPTNEAFDQFERVDASALIRFLHRARLLSDDASNAAEKLGELRNKYAHARGKNPETDALKSIQQLHILVEGTVSVLRDYEIVEGKFVPRARPGGAAKPSS